MPAKPLLELIPKSRPEKATQTVVDTISFTPQTATSWLLPPFQRALKVNAKVLFVRDQIKADGGVIPGMLTFGVMHGKRYLVDGQHRREAFLLSECPTGYADVRVCQFESMQEMADEYVRLNSALVKMTPDDVLRGLEESSPPLQKIRRACPWIGYDSIRRGPSNAILSMSVCIRAWFASRSDIPGRVSTTAADLTRQLTDEETNGMIDFLTLANGAWGGDREFIRLYGALNLTLCMWLYRRMVLAQYSYKTIVVDAKQWAKCIAALSANEPYVDWLTNRQLTEFHRSPAYMRITGLIGHAIALDTGKKPMFPRPVWASGTVNKRGGTKRGIRRRV